MQGADGIVYEVHLHPFGLFPDEKFREFLSDLIVAENECLEVDVVLRRLYCLEHGFVGSRTVNEEGDLVSRRQRIAAQGLHQADGFFYQLFLVRPLLLTGKDGLRLCRADFTLCTDYLRRGRIDVARDGGDVGEGRSGASRVQEHTQRPKNEERYVSHAALDRQNQPARRQGCKVFLMASSRCFSHFYRL